MKKIRKLKERVLYLDSKVDKLEYVRVLHVQSAAIQVEFFTANKAAMALNEAQIKALKKELNRQKQGKILGYLIGVALVVGLVIK